jgi:hypothetical protein
MRKVRKYAVFGIAITCEYLLMRLFADIFGVPEEMRWRIQSGEENHLVVVAGVSMIFLTTAALLFVNAKTIAVDYDSVFFRFIKSITFSPELKAKNVLFFTAIILVFIVVGVNTLIAVEAIRGITFEGWRGVLAVP